MAGAPPADFGGNREFLADPNNAGMSTVLGDMAALNLNLIHVLGDAIPAANRAQVNLIAARTRQVLAASNASQAREQATRELRPITQVPDADFGVHVNTAQIRMHNVPTFSGNGTDTFEVVRWISRIFNVASSHTLTLAATINLMIMGSTGGAADYIEQMREEGKNLRQIVQQLEMRYGDLCTPEEARVKCNNMLRKDKEGLPEFIDRLRAMSRMACRLEVDAPARRAAIDLLVEGNIRRVLPSSVRNALEERVINRNRMGLPAFNAREIEKECLDLERRRDERRLNIAEQGIGKRRIQLMQQEEPEDTSSDSSDSDGNDDDEKDSMFHLVQAIKQQQKVEAAKGRPVDPQKVYRRAFRNYNRKFPPGKPYRKAPYPGKAPQCGAAHAIGAGAAAGNNRIPGPPNKLEGPRKTITELLDLANVARGQCIQCGGDGHIMHQDACVLKDLVLVDRPCVKCGHGLHAADNCPRVFQQKYIAPPVGNANLLQNDPLNED